MQHTKKFNDKISNITQINKPLLTIVFALTTSLLQAQNVNIPDANFKAALLAHDPKIDLNNDSEIQISEAQAAKYVIVSNKSIKSLVGIEAFTSCFNLSCQTNLLETLDLRKNLALKQLFCNNNQLNSLELGENSNLAELFVYSNQLETIDLTKNINLNHLSCSSNKLTSLNVKNNPLLNHLSCVDNKLTNLDIRQNTALTTLLCSINASVSMICINGTQQTRIASNSTTWVKDVSAEWSLDCLDVTSLDDHAIANKAPKILIRVLNSLGQEIQLGQAVDGVFIFQYSDGSTQKIAK